MDSGHRLTFFCVYVWKEIAAKSDLSKQLGTVLRKGRGQHFKELHFFLIKILEAWHTNFVCGYGP